MNTTFSQSASAQKQVIFKCLAFLFDSQYISPLGTKPRGSAGYTESHFLSFVDFCRPADWTVGLQGGQCRLCAPSSLDGTNEAQGPRMHSPTLPLGRKCAPAPEGRRGDREEGRGEVPGPSAEVALAFLHTGCCVQRFLSWARCIPINLWPSIGSSVSDGLFVMDSSRNWKYSSNNQSPLALHAEVLQGCVRS